MKMAMMIWLHLTVIAALGIGLLFLLKSLERRTRIPGLFDLVFGMLLLILGLTGLASGHRLIPIYFILSGMLLLYRATGPVLTQIWRKR